MQGLQEEKDIIVKGASRTKEFLFDFIAKEFGFKSYSFKHSNHIAFRAPAPDSKNICNQLRNKGLEARLAKTYFIPELLLAEKYLIGRDRSAPEFGRLGRRGKSEFWHLDQIGAYAAQQVTQGEEVKVLIPDTGVDYTHQELVSVFSKPDKGYNFVNDSDDPFDDNGHGTHVAGLLAGLNPGVATKCNPYSAKVLNAAGYGSEVAIVRAIEWGIDNEIDLISMSLGSSEPSQLEKEVIDAAVSRGILIFAAAGNEEYGATYPAAYSGVISVAAVDSENEHAWFSNIHKTVDLSAPGVDVLSCIPGNNYAQLSGTSMATPLAAGVGTLLVSLRNNLGPEEYENLLKQSCQKLGLGEEYGKEKYGAGLVRADRVVGASADRERVGRIGKNEFDELKLLKKFVKLMVD